MTDRRRPVHLAVGLGISAGLYAASLAAVATLQASQDLAEGNERAPALDALAALRARNDRFGAGLESAGAAYDQAAGGYEGVAAGIDRLDVRLSGLAGTVAGIEGAAVSLPDRAPLPPVSRAKVVAAPTVHATTRASGG